MKRRDMLARLGSARGGGGLRCAARAFQGHQPRPPPPPPASTSTASLQPPDDRSRLPAPKLDAHAPSHQPRSRGLDAVRRARTPKSVARCGRSTAGSSSMPSRRTASRARSCSPAHACTRAMCRAGRAEEEAARRATATFRTRTISPRLQAREYRAVADSRSPASTRSATTPWPSSRAASRRIGCAA